MIVDSKTLNLKLLSQFPELGDAYNDLTVWQEGDDTGSHVVFGDLLVPLICDLIRNQQYALAKRYFDFIENLLEENDDYTTNVVAVSVIEAIVLDDVDQMKVEPLLGNKTLAIWNEFTEYYK